AFQNGVSSYDGSSWTMEAMGNIKDIHVDSINQIWAASTDVGLLYYDGSTWTNFRTNNTGGFNSDVVNCVTDDGKGNIFVGFDPQGNWAGGMAKYDGTNWERWTTQINNLPDARVNKIAFKADGTMLLATDGGLLEGSAATWTAYTTANSDLPSNTVNAVAIDENGLIWVGTEMGFATFDGTTWTVFNASNIGLPDNRVRDIAFDNTGHTWLATGNGVAVYKAGGATVSLDEPVWAQDLRFAITPNQLTTGAPLNLVLDLPQNEMVQISVFDLQGKSIYKQAPQQMTAGLHRSSLALADLSQGMYVVRLQVGNVFRTEKFVVQ
ncbi:MAG: two-component regulator propeller domain-containing protein, partial [Bacteroidota bacterium]